MVRKKRLDNRSIGFQVSIIPRAPRSAKRRDLPKKTTDSRTCCAIELLASLAGILLQETESSAPNIASEENHQLANHKDALEDQVQYEDKPFKSKEQESYGDGVFVSEEASENSEQKDSLKRSAEVASGTLWDCTSAFTGSAHSEKEISDAKSIISKSDLFHFGSPKSEKLVAVNKQGNNETFLKDSMGDHNNVPRFPNAFSSRQSNGMKLKSKDDGNKFYRFSESCSSRSKPYKLSHHIVNRKIRKLLTSKHWKVHPQLKDVEPSKSHGERKITDQKQRTFYSHERYPLDFLRKRRKLLHGSHVMPSYGVLSSETDSSSHHKGMNGVKFSIKSFKIPKLAIDVPETATVGSLKRTIMETVTTILGRGLSIGVLFRGKKIRDDNRTLLQTGISCKENLNTLGFMLEPNLTQPLPTSIATEDTPCILHFNIPQQLTGTLDKPISDMGASDDPANLTTMCTNTVDNCHEPVVSSNPDISTDSPLSESRAVVPIPQTNIEPLAIVPANQKNRHYELSLRRIRRPFSVSEVEALVQAVEELGTGRWRDVKLRAFENADLRTYVDLKDKWKTLVHTASITPQRRRGEPVPQELLDRVMAAHSFWSQHQSKHNGKVNTTAGTPPGITGGPATAPGIGVKGI